MVVKPVGRRVLGIRRRIPLLLPGVAPLCLLGQARREGHGWPVIFRYAGRHNNDLQLFSLFSVMLHTKSGSATLGTRSCYYRLTTVLHWSMMLLLSLVKVLQTVLRVSTSGTSFRDFFQDR
jgi:hypothetical protein